MKRYLIIWASMLIETAVTVVLISSPANAASARLHKSQPFTEARQHLLKTGWKPNISRREPGYEYVGVERELMKNRITEFDACSIDTSNCILYYKKNGSCLKLSTMGEHLSLMKVVGWTSECRAR